MQNISQTLAGRVAVTRLLPLSISELKEDANIDTNTLMWKGFYPGVWGDGKDPGNVYDSYVSTYLQRDVRQILNIKETHPLRGAIFENMVVCEMLKKRYNQGLKSNLFFYRDQTAEVDVIQEEANKIKAYEIKSAERFNQEFTKSLSYMQKLFGDDISSSYIIYSGKEEMTFKNFSLINYHNI